MWSIIPLGGDFSDGSARDPSSGSATSHAVQLADPPIGILLVLALSSIAVYGIMLAGWASGSKYPLLGAVRASAQMVSYEAALGLESRRGAAQIGDPVDGWHREPPGHPL